MTQVEVKMTAPNRYIMSGNCDDVNEGDREVIEMTLGGNYEYRKYMAKLEAERKAQQEEAERCAKINMWFDAAIYTSLLVLSMVAISMAWG